MLKGIFSEAYYAVTIEKEGQPLSVVFSAELDYQNIRNIQEQIESTGKADAEIIVKGSVMVVGTDNENVKMPWAVVEV